MLNSYQLCFFVPLPSRLPAFCLGDPSKTEASFRWVFNGLPDILVTDCPSFEGAGGTSYLANGWVAPIPPAIGDIAGCYRIATASNFYYIHILYPCNISACCSLYLRCLYCTVFSKLCQLFFRKFFIIFKIVKFLSKP